MEIREKYNFLLLLLLIVDVFHSFCTLVECWECVNCVSFKWIITCCVCAVVLPQIIFSNIIIFYTFLCLISYFLLVSLSKAPLLGYAHFIYRLVNTISISESIGFSGLKCVEGGEGTHEPNGIIKHIFFSFELCEFDESASANLERRMWNRTCNRLKYVPMYI